MLGSIVSPCFVELLTKIHVAAKCWSAKGEQRDLTSILTHLTVSLNAEIFSVCSPMVLVYR